MTVQKINGSCAGSDTLWGIGTYILVKDAKNNVHGKETNTITNEKRFYFYNDKRLHKVCKKSLKLSQPNYNKTW